MRRLEFDLLGRRCLAGVAIEGEIARRHLQLFISRFSGGRIRALDIDLDVTRAVNLAGFRLVAALARVDVVVAIAGASVDRDPDVFEQAAIFVLESGGRGSANREDGAVLLHLGELEFCGLLLNGGGHRGRRGVARARGLNRALRVDAAPQRARSRQPVTAAHRAYRAASWFRTRDSPRFG